MSSAQPIGATAIVLMSLGSVALPAFGAWEPVEGLIEGRLSSAGRPIVGAQITACADLGSRIRLQKPCTTPIATRTDLNGRFSFRQFTGVTPPTREDIKKFPGYQIADPGWSYEFRVDFEGTAAVYPGWGLGWGRTHVRLECDFGAFLASAKRQGIRPVANPDHMLVMECAAHETALMPP